MSDSTENYRGDLVATQEQIQKVAKYLRFRFSDLLEVELSDHQAEYIAGEIAQLFGMARE